MFVFYHEYAKWNSCLGDEIMYANTCQLIVSLDLPTIELASKLVKKLKPCSSCIFKIGLELLPIGGAEYAAELVRQGYKVFLDYKLHDIPRTVEAATHSIAGLGADFLTIHALPQIMEAAIRGRSENSKLKLLGVTVLTSLDDQALIDMGYRYTVRDLVYKRVEQALEAGCDGIVASPLEVLELRKRFGNDFMIVTPGVRLNAHTEDDQKRIATPQQAIESGASYIVVGRPITQSEDPLQTTQSILNLMNKVK